MSFELFKQDFYEQQRLNICVYALDKDVQNSVGMASYMVKYFTMYAVHECGLDVAFFDEKLIAFHALCCPKLKTVSLHIEKLNDAVLSDEALEELYDAYSKMVRRFYVEHEAMPALLRENTNENLMLLYVHHISGPVTAMHIHPCCLMRIYADDTVKVYVDTTYFKD